MTSYLIGYLLAAIFELLGCYAFWLVYRDHYKWPLLVIALIPLCLFAYCLTFIPSSTAGRTYAGYGGVYILVAFLVSYFIEDIKLDIFDLLGVIVCLLGTAIILFSPHKG